MDHSVDVSELLCVFKVKCVVSAQQENWLIKAVHYMESNPETLEGETDRRPTAGEIC